MTSNIRTVFDTNVLISAALMPRSIPRQALNLGLARGATLISTATFAEVDEVLRRPKFDKYIREEKRLEFLAALVREAKTVEVTEVVSDCRDPKDNKFLELAVSGKATHIISGDDDLLVLHPFRGIAIVTPQAFIVGVQSGGD
jgi:putative PIN family toxin of toxin-antitoxin system